MFPGIGGNIHSGFGEPLFNPVTQDYTSGTWTTNSFYFGRVNNSFSGDSVASNIINLAMTGSNVMFDIVICVRRLSIGITQVLFCRDNSTTSVRQFSVFFTNLNKFIINFWDTPSTNNIQWTSTATFTETREFNTFRISYDGTQVATSRVTVRRNEIIEAGATVENGSFTTINNTAVNSIEVGGRINAANYSSAYTNHIAVFNTNLSVASGYTMFNNRVPFDLRTNSGLNANLVLYLSADSGATFTTNWIWTDLAGGATFTSSGMTTGDTVNLAPGLKQVSLLAIHGQSNSTGREWLYHLPSRFTGSLSWMKVWTGNTMINADTTTNNNQYIEKAGQYGIEYYLSEYLNRQVKKTIYVFKVTLGGTSLAYDGNGTNWRYPDVNQGSGGQMYQQLHNNDIPNLKEWELANGYTINKIRFVWMQGEADSQNFPYATAYSNSFSFWLTGASNGMFTLLNSKFYIQPKLYDLTISTALSANTTLTALTNVNTAKTAVQLLDPDNRRIVVSDGVTFLSNNFNEVHYDDKGIRLLASRFGPVIVSDGF